MEEQKFKIICGIDWGSEKHDACAMTPQRTVVFEREIAHEPSALHRLIDALVELAGGDPGAVAVAIETPHGVVVETLMDRGVAVFAINPKKLDRFRDRHTVAGAKDDRRDAWVAAGALCTDPHVFTYVEPAGTHSVELREEGRLHEEIRDERMRVANRLREQLQRYFPQFLELGTVEELWLWVLWEKAPTPEAAQQHLRQSTVQKILRAHRIRRLNATEILTVLRAPGFSVRAETRDAAVRHIGLLLPQLRLLDGQEKETTRRIESLLKRLVEQNATDDDPSCPGPKHSDAKIILSLPGVGSLNLATILGEAGTAIEKRDLTLLRLHSGAPVTRRSGKSLVVVRRHQCNPRLRNACRSMAFSALNCDAASRQHYDEIRARGHEHERALRGVADRLLSVLIAMLKSGTLYDPKLRRRNSQLAA